MKRISGKWKLGVAAAAAMAFVGLHTSTAQAAHGFGGFGFHFGGPNVHFDIGNPHGLGCRNQGVYKAARNYYPRHKTRAHYVWHDTSHYDYHPGGYVRHGNHFDYVPGHYDFHREGHYDRHRGGHHRSGRHRGAHHGEAYRGGGHH